jgi:WD40 repeat protein
MVDRVPQSLISVFETEHLICAPEWADPDDPDSEAINSWGDDGDVQEMVFSPDGQTLAVRWLEGNGVDIWDFRKAKTGTYGTYTHVPITAFAFLGNKKVVVGRGNEIEVLDLERHAVKT